MHGVRTDVVSFQRLKGGVRSKEEEHSESYHGSKNTRKIRSDQASASYPGDPAWAIHLMLNVQVRARYDVTGRLSVGGLCSS